ncbi:MAG: LysR family transcriptional regulator [Oscillospiraceae bacterium]|nr:LysR family transcriptional regulator [Oscillospiraceae bacterium]
MYHLEYVLAVAEERNLTRAAQKLYITQPTLTKYLNRLEEDLGVQLFDRSVQPIRTTRAGQVFIADMQKIQTREMNLRAKLKAISRDEDSFSVGIQTIRAEYVLPAVLPAFLEKYPHVSVRTDSRVESAMESAVGAGELDVAIGALTLAYEELEYRFFREDEVLLLLSRKHPAASGIAPEVGTLENPCLIDHQMLHDERVLLPRSGGGQFRAAMLMLEKYRISYSATVQSTSLHALFQLAAENAGILFTTPWEIGCRFPEEAKKLAFCRLQPEPFMQRSYLCWKKERGEDAIIRDFAEAVCLTKKA